MNTLSVLQTKAERVSMLVPQSGIFAVLRHVEIGERHFELAKQEDDSDYFADVVYRTNHAFEGILRESYTILAEKDPANKTIYEIESYLSQNNIFQDRVMDLFTNYRTKWRNPSTHDHLAAFSEAEAFLALLSVTAFIGILLDQMIERISFNKERERLAGLSAEAREGLVGDSTESFFERITFALENFASQDINRQLKSETELAGNLSAYLATILPNIKTQQGPLLRDKLGSLRPDFLVSEENNSAIIELRRGKSFDIYKRNAIMNVVRRYMDAADAHLGVVIFFPPSGSQLLDRTSATRITYSPVDGSKIVVIQG